MASVSATHLILFIASLVIAVGVTGVIVGEVGQLSDAVENRGTGVAEEIETDVVIVSDEARSDAIYDSDNETVTLLVKNTGSTDPPVDPRVIDVLIDGRYIGNEELTVSRVDVDDSETWRPGGVVEVTATGQQLQGDTELSVVVGGNEDSINIHV